LLKTTQHFNRLSQYFVTAMAVYRTATYTHCAYVKTSDIGSNLRTAVQRLNQHTIRQPVRRYIFNFIHHCRSDSKQDNKQTVNKQGKPNMDTIMTKLPVIHIYSTNYQTNGT